MRLAVDLADVPSRPTLKVCLDGAQLASFKRTSVKSLPGIRIEAGLTLHQASVKSFGEYG